MGETKCKEKCPKGYYGSCNASGIKCEPCPHGTYTDVENMMDKCLPCRGCSSNNLITYKECEANSNRQCKCAPGFYCINSNVDHCDHCIPVARCPKGQGVIRQHTHLENTVCSPCTEGTYNDLDDYTSSCKNHTSCDSLGRVLKDRGTQIKDATCGDFKAHGYCHWMLPAGLWAGLVVTAILIFLAVLIIRRRSKRRSSKSVLISEYWSCASPTLPPDILKYPADCGVEKHEDGHKLTHICTVENYPDMDSATKCDLGTMPVMKVSENYVTANEYPDRNTCHSMSIYQSQPQESEWHE
ncbi:uncharacterized protein [Paramisgurnus dabryanus]|uniref:uncharacterized protein isoform X1 n=1 Tax=Paramisgurnus dabryanus TaxID=90735 RepID=UPI0031F3F016